MLKRNKGEVFLNILPFGETSEQFEVQSSAHSALKQIELIINS